MGEQYKSVWELIDYEFTLEDYGDYYEITVYSSGGGSDSCYFYKEDIQEELEYQEEEKGSPLSEEEIKYHTANYVYEKVIYWRYNFDVVEFIEIHRQAYGLDYRFLMSEAEELQDEIRRLRDRVGKYISHNTIFKERY